MHLVGSVLYGADERVGELVASMIPHVGPGGFGTRGPDGRLPYTALGVVRGQMLLGGVVFHNFRPDEGLIEESGAFSRADWIRPSTLRHLFSYPFTQLGCANLITITGRKNVKARKMNEFLGFRLVGIIHRKNEDAALYEMPRKNCRWLKDKANGK